MLEVTRQLGISLMESALEETEAVVLVLRCDGLCRSSMTSWTLFANFELFWYATHSRHQPLGDGVL